MIPGQDPSLSQLQPSLCWDTAGTPGWVYQPHPSCGAQPRATCWVPLDTLDLSSPSPACAVLLDTPGCIIPKLLSLFSFFHPLFTTVLCPSLFSPKYITCLELLTQLVPVFLYLYPNLMFLTNSRLLSHCSEFPWYCLCCSACQHTQPSSDNPVPEIQLSK